jgi:predicted 3-demethylubiquinone-9 3-methyltransferase (glyoxalase superfamily)
MAALAHPKIHPHLWFEKDVEAAVQFYVSIFPDSKIDRVTTMPADSPSGPAGSVVVVEYTLLGAPFMAMQAGPLDPFNHAISLMVMCDDQAEIDRYNAALLKGGSQEPCGWVKDRYGLSWQIVPRQLQEMMASSDRVAAKRATEAMLTMHKLDLAALEKAFKG